MHREGHEAQDKRALFSLLGVAGFGSVLCTRVCDAMLPALAQDFSTSIGEAAATVSAYAMAYAVMQLVYGPLGDRYGKLRVIGLAALFCALSSACAALAPSLFTLVLSRVGMGIGAAAVVPLVVAWIGDNVELVERQQWLARYAGYTVIGLVISPVLGGVCAQLISWRVSFVPTALLFVVLAFKLLHGRHARSPSGRPKPPPLPYLHQVRGLLASARTRFVLAATLIETALGIAPLAFVPTVLHERFGLDLLMGGLVAGMFGVGGFVFSRSASSLMQRSGRAALPLTGGLSLALAYGGLAIIPHWAWAMPACALAGFGFFAIHNTLQLQATQLSTSASGLAVSMFASCIFIGQSGGVALLAVSVARADPAWSFAAAALGLAVLGWVVRRFVLQQASVPTQDEGAPLSA